MSDISGGRAANGGARTGGPVPVSSSKSSGIRTPRDVMNARNAREAQRQEEQKAAEEQRRQEERRRSAERRAAAAGNGGAPRFSQASSQYTPDVSAQQGQFDAGADRRSGAGRVAGSDALGDPTGRSSPAPPTSRNRGPGMSQQDQPRPVPGSTGGARRAPSGQQTQRQTSQPSQAQSQPGFAGATAQQPRGDGPPQRGANSSFPHAFERWETLSSHWEGLTNYWLHKLESNSEEIEKSVPNAVTLNRQITDLSAAGANLFHAVVELQRLRASSERKFQRWFFETRADNERNHETQAQVEEQLKKERSNREETAKARADASIQAENAKREVAEMRRELMISKDEARRAWEELGRRNQDSLETAQALKDGRITLVGGVQVVPYFGGPSRTGSASQRPTTRDGQQQYGSTGVASAAGAAGLQSPGDEEQYYRREPSPTNTDPFTESSARPQPLHHEQAKTSLASGTYQPQAYGGTPNSGSTQQTAIPTGSQRPGAASAGSSRIPQSQQQSQQPPQFYQHAPQETYLHSPPRSSHEQPQQQPGAHAPQQHEGARSEASYVDTLSEGDTEYAIDAAGNIRHDDNGRPIVFRRPQHHQNTQRYPQQHPQPGPRQQPQRSAPSEPSAAADDDYDDTTAAIPHERDPTSRYQQRNAPTSHAPASSSPLPSPPSIPATSAQAMASFAPPTTTTSSVAAPPEAAEGVGAGAASSEPDYEGEGYGSWEALQGPGIGRGEGGVGGGVRHHHPTRLSDVLEEEEERSSRRTGYE